ncbi:MAG TPA: hypothetical protein VGR02_10580 [Thermoanaerobaculia bacterium]|nr:hypothetical protein [Thermoanaerobaculia bacterium]
MKTRALLILLLAVAALPAAAQVNDTYIIPVSGLAPGAFGTQWQTQLSIFNPQLDHSLRVSMTFIPTGGKQGKEAFVDIPANAVYLTDNVLKDVFNTTGTGSLLVATFPEDNPTVPNAVLDRAFLVTSNTFNNSRNGTFGQTIPGVFTGLQGDGISAVAHGVRNVAKDGWRANIGAVNLGRSSVTMRVSVYDYDGKTVRSNMPFILPPLAHLQEALPVEVDSGSVEFFLDDPSGEAVVFPYVSVIDQFSGDPAYQTPILLASAKSLYGKKAAARTAVVGRKIDIEIARGVRASAERLGAVFVKTK